MRTRLRSAPLLAGLWAALAFFATSQVVAGTIDCENGMAGEFPCADVDFLSFMPIAALGGDAETKAANLWGWTDPLTRREYVILGLTDATVFVDVSNPAAPVYLGRLPTATVSSVYRDIKVRGGHAFIIADLPSAHGMQVFDLTRLRGVDGDEPVEFEASAHFDGFGDAHNLYINRESGFAYVMRTTTPEVCGAAVTIVDINDPLNPELAGCLGEGGLASDAMCVNYRGADPEFQGREICIVASDDDILIADATDKSAPRNLASVGYPDIARAHNAWLTYDHNYFVSADMVDEIQSGLNTRIMVWDFRDVDDPQLIGIYQGPTTASDHNVWVRGKRAYIGNFHAGLRILDLANIDSGELTERAFFDMVPADDNPGHVGGAWAVYPFFPSRVIAVSDKETGLYLLHARPDLHEALDYRYAMDDGSEGGGQIQLFDDATFVDDGGDRGRWTMQPEPRRLLLQYDAGRQCEAFSVGRLLGDGRVGGVRQCRDGSGLSGTWNGRVVAPEGRAAPGGR